MHPGQKRLLYHCWEQILTRKLITTFINIIVANSSLRCCPFPFLRRLGVGSSPPSPGHSLPFNIYLRTNLSALPLRGWGFLLRGGRREIPLLQRGRVQSSSSLGRDQGCGPPPLNSLRFSTAKAFVMRPRFKCGLSHFLVG